MAGSIPLGPGDNRIIRLQIDSIWNRHNTGGLVGQPAKSFFGEMADRNQHASACSTARNVAPAAMPGLEMRMLPSFTGSPPWLVDGRWGTARRCLFHDGKVSGGIDIVTMDHVESLAGMKVQEPAAVERDAMFGRVEPGVARDRVRKRVIFRPERQSGGAAQGRRRDGPSLVKCRARESTTASCPPSLGSAVAV